MLNNWQNIHHKFINDLQQKWEIKGFSYEQAKEWINIGLKPTDYKLAAYIRYELGYKPEEALDFADLATLRTYTKGNCQHFANRAVLGLNITNEGTWFKKNRALKEEINRISRHFENLRIIGNDRHFYLLVRKGIKDFANRANDQTKKMKLVKVGEGKYTARIVHNYPWKWKQPVELKPSSDCKIQ